MDLESKIDKILEDVATIKVVSSVHTSELKELKDRLEPVFTHVTGMKTLARVSGAIVGVLLGVISCVAAVLLLFK